jgi:energy-coupling factor transporter transmembrane protein EcfT
MTWTLFFVPLIAFWAPTLSASHRLQPTTLVLALICVTAATFSISWLGDRVIYAFLLRDCPPVDRAPSRLERHASSGQFGLTRANLRAAAFPTSPLCLAAGLTTILIGFTHGDPLMMISGAILSAIFAWPVALDFKDRIQNRLLSPDAEK